MLDHVPISHFLLISVFRDALCQIKDPKETKLRGYECWDCVLNIEIGRVNAHMLFTVDPDVIIIVNEILKPVKMC